MPSNSITETSRCAVCGKPGVRLRRMTRSYGRGMTLLVIENVPVFVCPHCGESYVTADTLHAVERIKLHRRKLAAPRPVAVAKFTRRPASEAVFRILNPTELGLTDSGGRDFGVAKPNLRQIVSRGERDSPVNGALIGAGIGSATAAILLAVAATGDGYVLASAKWGVPLLLSAVGGVIGVFVDRAHTDDQVVYVRP